MKSVLQVVPGETQPRRQRGLSHNLAWALAAEATTLMASLVSVKVITNHLGTVQYGKYAAIYGLVGFAVSSCTSWAGLVIPQWIAREKEDPATTMHSTLTYLGMLSAVGMVIVVVLGGLLVPNVSLTGIAALASAELIGGAGVLPLVMLAQSAVSVRAGLWIRMAGAMAKIVALIVVAFRGSVTFGNIGIALLISQVAVWLVSGALLARHLGFVARPGAPLRHHLSTAATFMVSVGSYSVFEEGDKPIMTASHHELDAGLYGIAYRISRLAMVPLAAMENATHMQSVQRGETAGEHVRRAIRFTRLGAAYGVVAVIGLNVFGPLLLRILEPKFGAAITQLRWLSPLVVLRGCRSFSDNGLLGLGKLRTRMMLNLGSAFLSLVLYIALIPRYSWKGALAATVVTEAALVVASWSALLTYQRRENFILGRVAARRLKASVPL